MSAVANSQILGQYEKAIDSQAYANKSITQKDTFLKLLVAQMANQDPLNPMDDTEFIAQMAQFTTVEELSNLNETVTHMSDLYTQSQVTNAVSLIGAAVDAQGDFITFIADSEGKNNYSTPMIATLPANAAEVYVDVYATDGEGNIGALVYSGTLGAKNAGDINVTWDGKGNNGSTMPDGVYVMNVKAVDANGNEMYPTKKSSGVVVGVETSLDGNHKLHLNDGRTVNYQDVEMVYYVANQQPEDPEKPVDPEDPEKPVDPEEPEKPVDPENPVDPDGENPDDGKEPQA